MQPILFSIAQIDAFRDVAYRIRGRPNSRVTSRHFRVDPASATS
ncbi:hypothetical protein ThidrDRAFT_3607 [Thiorhodococcus drewsii AZ1]|uniref:Uncharacterized protein n=1 Tax=Thiorhodococcus drewsii AZ1 TaxID=765913 RepID=G2E5P4_9GAMM|nr:hypothetical protein ThidrDRAFT_3607 [Thiorhodococcus drewsii AZ1]